jgi:hypothetical protein
MKLRQGRKVGRTIYLQRGAEPSDGDALIGVMDTPGLAALIVACCNAEMSKPHAWVPPPIGWAVDMRGPACGAVVPDWLRYGATTHCRKPPDDPIHVEPQRATLPHPDQPHSYRHSLQSGYCLTCNQACGHPIHF